jgi:hypothetical protein
LAANSTSVMSFISENFIKTFLQRRAGGPTVGAQRQRYIYLLM